STDGRIFQYRVRRSATGVSILALVKRLVPGVHFPKSTAMFVFCDDNGLLWCSMADNQGIFLLNPKKRKPYLRRYTTADGLPDESVRAIYEDRHGNLWFGGYSDGLSMLPADESLLGKFRLFTTANGLPNGAIRAVTEDAGGTLWVGTRYGGIAFLKDSLFHPLSLKEGLLSTAVWSAARRLDGDLLIGTQLGFQTFSPAATRFLKKKEFGADPVFSCGQLSSGIIWFLSTAGLTVYDPSRDRDNPVAPPILITGFEVNGVAYPTTGAFELSNDQDNCSVEVAGISLRDEESLEYQYRLIGADDEWRPPRNNRSFVFASLAPGTYTFMARAVTSRGVVSSEPAVLRFTILLPFWRQWWFVGGTVLCLFLVALIAVRLRLSRLLALEHLRSSIATDLHDDIGSGLTRIAILSDVAYKQVQSAQRGSRSATDESAEVLGGLEKVRDTARGLIESMSDVVWAIDPSHDSFERLVQRLRSFAYELCEGRNIKLVFTVGEKVESAKMSSEGLRNVLLFSKEALTNIAKHSHCTKAELSVNLAGRRIVVTVSDNGKGFNASTVEPGNGLGNMRKRTELAGGSFKLTSKVDKGTTIVASFPLAG
ncbi:MAG TPA: two-component regulator propeller domain-containing protein, partial [Bacteroidota bacterium]